jgi:hypothetical protein
MSRLGRADYFQPGDWNIACSECGRKRKASYVQRNWQGLWRCPEHNEPRQPQDFARGVKDVMTVPFAQFETNMYNSFCTLAGRSGVVYYAVAGCSISGNPYYPGPYDVQDWTIDDPHTTTDTTLNIDSDFPPVPFI